MSPASDYRQSYKDVSNDDGLDEDLSSLELALNGKKSYKGLNGSLLHPEPIRSTSFSDDGRGGRSPSQASHLRYASQSPAPPRTWKASRQAFWQRNRGLILVAMSQFFGVLMNVTTRLLELEGEGMNPIQILFVRMSLTGLCCCAYMWYTKVPFFPFGPKGTRALLVARGMTGFFGIFGMYYSLQYLPMADATVITFLAPSVAGYACYLLIGERFTKIEQIGSYVSLLGVVMIARPTTFFSVPVSDVGSGIPSNATVPAVSSDHEFNFPTPTREQRLSAIAVSLLGVLGAAGAYTTIRWIGKRAHPLISVNYFATWCTIVSTVVLSVGPYLPAEISSSSLHFALPNSLRQWAMLIFLGACGFIMQFMLTAGMSHEKSNRATNMVYTNMLFALLFDRWIFGTVPDTWSILGCVCILGSAVYVAVQKQTMKEEEAIPTRASPSTDEERGMLSDVDGISEAQANIGNGANSRGGDIELSDVRT